MQKVGVLAELIPLLISWKSKFSLSREGSIHKNTNTNIITNAIAHKDKHVKNCKHSNNCNNNCNHL